LETQGRMNGGRADAILAGQLKTLLAGGLEPALHLDLLDAARKRGSKEVQALVKEFDARHSGDDPLAPYRVALEGGNAEAGRKVFFEKTAVSCVRCHKIDGRGGEVGPDLSKIAVDKDRQYILEAIVAPDKQIAKGFETVVLAMADGTIQTGVLREETESHLRIITPENVYVNVPKDEIEARTTGKSAMPADLVQQLSLFELRDLIQFLSKRK
jgi:quinoprotein glucose dehydrogenase